MDEEPMDVDDCGNVELPIRYRGMAILAIFSKFSTNLASFETYPDKKELVVAFQKLQYGVIIWDDVMSKETFLERLKNVASDKIHHKCETFALVVMTHGNANGKLYAHDKDFHLAEVLNIFKPKECPALKDKLKLFIFHACCGDNYGEGLPAKMSETDYGGALPPINKKENKTSDLLFRKLEEPIEKDNLILCSTFEGNVAVGGVKNKPSGFIADLTAVLKNEAEQMNNMGISRKNILDLLTEVLWETASRKFLIKNKDKDVIEIKQQPTIIMALSQLYTFFKTGTFPEEKLKSHLYRDD